MSIRRAVAPPLAACTAVATLLALGGCHLAERAAGGAAEEPAPTASHSPLTPDRPKLRTSTVTVDGVTLRVGSRKAAVVRAEDHGAGTRTVSLSLPPGSSARLALASPGALEVDPDGSITVLDGSGVPVAAVSPPAPPSGTEDETPRIEVTDTDATHTRLEVDGRRARPALSDGDGDGDQPARTEPVRVTFVVGTRAIESATWGENEGGRSLAVDPTDWARHAGEAGLNLIRTQLVAAEPDAGSATMEHQLVCHALGAPDKTTWNLEPWRPDVGLILTATAQCNPT